MTFLLGEGEFSEEKIALDSLAVAPSVAWNGPLPCWPAAAWAGPLPYWECRPVAPTGTTGDLRVGSPRGPPPAAPRSHLPRSPCPALAALGEVSAEARLGCRDLGLGWFPVSKQAEHPGPGARLWATSPSLPSWVPGDRRPRSSVSTTAQASVCGPAGSCLAPSETQQAAPIGGC